MADKWLWRCAIAALGLQAWPGLAQVNSSAPEPALRIEYVAPKSPAHQSLYEALRRDKVLERLEDGLNFISLPRTLLLKVEGCDGDVNAAYDPDEAEIGICYEYLAYIQELATKIPPDIAAKESLDPKSYVVGPFLEVALHELAHAIFDLKKVPVLGREEDAADQVAAYALLQLDKDEVRKVIASIAVMYASEAKEAPPKLKDFSNEHGLPAQRFYNLLCMSYGADDKTFGDFVARGYLPPERAEQCADEYKQVSYAFSTLIRPVIGAAKPPARRQKLFQPR